MCDFLIFIHFFLPFSHILSFIAALPFKSPQVQCKPSSISSSCLLLFCSFFLFLFLFLSFLSFLSFLASPDFPVALLPHGNDWNKITLAFIILVENDPRSFTDSFVEPSWIQIFPISTNVFDFSIHFPSPFRTQLELIRKQLIDHESRGQVPSISKLRKERNQKMLRKLLANQIQAFPSTSSLFFVVLLCSSLIV